jgi:hypothetical protein
VGIEPGDPVFERGTYAMQEDAVAVCWAGDDAECERTGGEKGAQTAILDACETRDQSDGGSSWRCFTR